jgi:hypothetical protein
MRRSCGSKRAATGTALCISFFLKHQEEFMMKNIEKGNNLELLEAGHAVHQGIDKEETRHAQSSDSISTAKILLLP